MAVPAWKQLTTTVGLVTTRHPGGLNVMAAEWTYFLNKAPLYVGVALSRRAATRAMLPAGGEFSVTLCAEDQAAAADFAGSFSAVEVDKLSSAEFALGCPVATGTPWVTGGVAAFECVLRDRLDLPDYQLFVGEAVAEHPGAPGCRPLVKHGPMHALGPRLVPARVVAAAQLLPGGPPRLRVAAVGPVPGAPPWRLTLLPPHGDPLVLGEHVSGGHDDLLVEVPVPPAAAGPALSGGTVLVERAGARPGRARVSARPPIGVVAGAVAVAGPAGHAGPVPAEH